MAAPDFAPVDGRNALARVVDSNPFTVVVVATIGVNAVVLGLPTYDGDRGSLGPRWLDLVNAACLAVFVVELLVRIASYWPRPWAFFRSGWNVFDFVVVGAAFVPGIRQNSTLLRLARLLRVVRIVRVLPDLRVLLLGIWRSVPPLVSIGAVTAMILFVYGMVGWILFGDELPGAVGGHRTGHADAIRDADARGLPDVHGRGDGRGALGLGVLRQLHPRRRVHHPERADRRRAELDGGGPRARPSATAARAPRVTRPSPVDPEAHAPVAERIAILRSALDELELELALGAICAPAPTRPRPS